MIARGAIAIDALLALGAGIDTRAPGGEVTVALCGSWDHAGSCRWPHHSSIDAGAEPAYLRTVVVASEEDRDEIVRRVEQALRADAALVGRAVLDGPDRRSRAGARRPALTHPVARVAPLGR